MALKNRLADAAAGQVIRLYYENFNSEERKMEENEKRWNGMNNSEFIHNAFKKMNEEELKVIVHYLCNSK